MNRVIARLLIPSVAKDNAIPLGSRAIEIYIFKRGTTGESIGVNLINVIRYHYILKTCTVSKCGNANVCHTIRKCYACKIRTAKESRITNKHNAFGNNYALKVFIILERITANTRYANTLMLCRDNHVRIGTISLIHKIAVSVVIKLVFKSDRLFLDSFLLNHRGIFYISRAGSVINRCCRCCYNGFIFGCGIAVVIKHCKQAYYAHRASD